MFQPKAMSSSQSNGTRLGSGYPYSNDRSEDNGMNQSLKLPKGGSQQVYAKKFKAKKDSSLNNSGSKSSYGASKSAASQGKVMFV